MLMNNIDVTISIDERDLLLELIESAEKQMVQGIDHADSRAFKHQLRQRAHTLESLKRALTRGDISGAPPIDRSA